MNRMIAISFYSFNDGALDVVLPVIFLIQKTRWDETNYQIAVFSIASDYIF
jgi:hypothetical protein